MFLYIALSDIKIIKNDLIVFFAFLGSNYVEFLVFCLNFQCFA